MNGIDSWIGYDSSGILAVDGVSIRSLVNEFGSPLFILSKNRLESNYKEFADAFSRRYSSVSFFYSIKTNALPEVCKTLHNLGSCAEAVSSYEICLARKSGFQGKEIVFNGPLKTSDDIEYAFDEGIFAINADSLSEINEIIRLSRGRALSTTIGLRLDPFPEHNSKLGLDFSSAEEAFRQLRSRSLVDKVMIQMHLGTQIADPNLFSEAIIRLCDFLEHSSVYTVDALDVGGGFPSFPILTSTPLSIQDYADSICRTVTTEFEKRKWDLPSLILEPGRVLVSDTMMCVGTVHRVKSKGTDRWAICDIGFHTVPMLMSATYEITSGLLRGSKSRINLGGPLCASSDVLASSIELEDLREGDLVVVLNCGAYSVQFTSRFSFPRPPIIMIDNGKPKMIKTREVSDLTFSTSWG